MSWGAEREEASEPALLRGAAALLADFTAGTNLLARIVGLLVGAGLVGAVFGLRGAVGTVAGVLVIYVLWLPVRRRKRDHLRGKTFVWWGSAANPKAEENFFIKPWYGRGPGNALPNYVPRTAMPSLEAGLDDRDKRFVILTGNPTSGKSRLVYEVAKNRPGYVTFVASGAPAGGGPDHLRELMEDPLGFSTWEERQILVLRDMRQRLISRDIKASFMCDWLDRHPKVSVVATLNPEDVTKIEEAGEEARAELAALEARAELIEVKDTLEGKELRAARAAFPELTEEQLAWLPSYFVSATPLGDKFRGGDARSHALGVAIVRAVADWQRTGVSLPAPASFLYRIVPRYLTEKPAEDFEAAFERELEWALAPVQGAAALLYLAGPGKYRADGVIVEKIDVAQPIQPVPDFAWQAIRNQIIETCEGEEAAAELISMAECAHRAGFGELGQELLELAGELGSGAQYRRIAEVFTSSSVPGVALRALVGGRYDDSFRYRVRASREQTQARRDRVESEGKSIRSRIISEIYSHRWARSAMRFAVLASADLLSSALGIVIGVLLRSLVDVGGVHPATFFDDLSRSVILAWVTITIMVFALLKLYKEDAERARLAEILAAMGVLGLIGFGAAVAAELNIERTLTALVTAMVGAIVAALADYEMRQLYDRTSTGWVERNELVARTLLIGTARQAAMIEERVVNGISRPTEVVGYMTTDPNEEPGPNCLGSAEDPDSLAAVTLRCDAARVLIADPTMSVRERQDLADLCHLRGLKVEAVPSIADVRAGSARLLPGQSLVLIELKPLWLGNAAYAAKRTLDVTLALLSAPIVMSICIWSAAKILFFGGGRPIVVDSWRPGVGTKIFGMRRFRTRSDGAKSPIDPADRDDEAGGHVTTVGEALRRRGFDKLPQLLNVLTGKMSLVGPRPLHLSDRAKLADEHLLRYVSRPGVTGPWQVCGRAEMTCSELTEMDLAYLRNWTVFADLEILIKTLRLMIKGGDTSQVLIEDPQPAAPDLEADART